MKKILFLGLVILATAKIQAQDYLISFAGSGASTTVETVQVQNLTQGTSLSLNGSDVLHLFGTVGIEEIKANGDNSMRIYPNPMTNNSNITFEVSAPGMVTVELFDISGKKVIAAQNNLQAGTQTFNVSGLNSGIYTVSIKSDNFVYTGKMISKCTATGQPIINYAGSNSNSIVKKSLKSTESTVEMQYTTGDRILLKAVSGNYSTIKTLIPATSSLETFNFVAATDFDGNNYTTVTIGTQIWMAENLKVGIRIDGIQEQTNNGTIEKYCYNDDEANCAIYGGLYQWNEMMQYVTTPGVQGICPTGWHIPTDVEWTTLTDFLGGTSVAGGKMKATGMIETSTGLWQSPNTGATNENGFTAVPAGFRSIGGAFFYIGGGGFWWSSSEGSTDNALGRGIDYGYGVVGEYDDGENTGFSVRCLRDFKDN